MYVKLFFFEFESWPGVQGQTAGKPGGIPAAHTVCQFHSVPDNEQQAHKKIKWELAPS